MLCVVYLSFFFSFVFISLSSSSCVCVLWFLFLCVLFSKLFLSVLPTASSSSCSSSSSSTGCWLLATCSSSYPDPIRTEHTVLSGLYAIVFMVALVQLIRLHSRQKAWNTKKLFHALILLNNGGRAAFFFMKAWAPSTEETFVMLVFQTIPAIFLFSTYGLLIAFWAEVFHKAHSTSVDVYQNMQSKVRRVYYWVNAFMYLITGILLGLDFVLPQYTVLAMSIWMAFLCVLFIGGFLLYGVQLRNTLGRLNVLTQNRATQMIMVRRVMFIVTISFTIRAIMTVVFNFDDFTARFADVWWLILAPYYLISELIPSTLILWILRKMPGKPSAAQPLLRSSVPTGTDTSTSDDKLDYGFGSLRAAPQEHPNLRGSVTTFGTQSE